MMTKRFILLDVDYYTRKGNPIIRLFGKLADGRSIITLDKNFKPYFYVLPYEIEECLLRLAEFGLNKIEKISRKDQGERREILKITVNHPREMVKLKDEINELKSVEEIREYDITFPRRYLIDKGLFPMDEVEVKGKVLREGNNNEVCIIELQSEPRNVKSGLTDFNILSFKIEVRSKQERPYVSRDPIILISFHGTQGFQKVFTTVKSTTSFVETVPSEKDLLKKFVETINSENPDIILGYNSDKFDFPYIKGRADQLGVSLTLGVDGSKLKFINVPKKAAVIKGRVHIDLYRIVYRNLQLNSHTLKNVYHMLFKEDKIDIPASEVYNCWIDGGENRERLFRYSLEDAKTISRIGERMLPMSIELSRIVGQSLFEIVRRGTGTQVKWFLMRKAYLWGHVLPNEPGIFERNVEGGYVEEPVPGLHENIFYFDFRSLYPSIIIAKNISPETLTIDGDEETCHIAPEFGYKFKKKPIGFIPRVTSEILKERIRIKAMIEEADNLQERQILDFKQKALKTLIATIYGLYNHPQYRWYCVEASEAITAWGRDFLEETMKNAEMHGLRVLYADTDGFFATPIN